MSSIKKWLTVLVFAGVTLFAASGAQAGRYYNDYDSRYYRDDRGSNVGAAVLVGLAALVAYDRYDRRRDHRRYDRSRRHGYSNYGYRDRGYRDRGYRDRGYRDRGHRNHYRDRGYRNDRGRHRGW